MSRTNSNNCCIFCSACPAHRWCMCAAANAPKRLPTFCCRTTFRPTTTTPVSTTTQKTANKRHGKAARVGSSFRQTLSAWASTNPMYVPWYTSTCPIRSKPISKRPDAPDATKNAPLPFCSTTKPTKPNCASALPTNFHRKSLWQKCINAWPIITKSGSGRDSRLYSHLICKTFAKRAGYRSTRHTMR